MISFLIKMYLLLWEQHVSRACVEARGRQLYGVGSSSTSHEPQESNSNNQAFTASALTGAISLALKGLIFVDT